MSTLSQRLVTVIMKRAICRSVVMTPIIIMLGHYRIYNGLSRQWRAI